MMPQALRDEASPQRHVNFLEEVEPAARRRTHRPQRIGALHARGAQIRSCPAAGGVVPGFLKQAPQFAPQYRLQVLRVDGKSQRRSRGNQKARKGQCRRRPQKDRRLNIRISTKDLEAIQKRRLREA